jgi:hypothetical protein
MWTVLLVVLHAAMTVGLEPILLTDTIIGNAVRYDCR